MPFYFSIILQSAILLEAAIQLEAAILLEEIRYINNYSQTSL